MPRDRLPLIIDPAAERDRDDRFRLQEDARHTSDDPDLGVDEAGAGDINLGQARKLRPATATTLTAAGIGPATDIVWASFKRPRNVTLILQATGPGVQIDIETSLGGSAHFNKTFVLPAGAARVVRVFGRTLYCRAAMLNHNFAPVTVAGAICPFDIDPLGELWCTWVPSPINEGNGTLNFFQQIADGPCYFLGCQGYLIPGEDSTPYYVQIYDLSADDIATAGGIPAGSVPLVSLGPLKLGSTFSFDRSLRADIQCFRGCAWGLSSDPSVYAGPPGGDPTVHLDADFGV
jgi:hypothetical protein